MTDEAQNPPDVEQHSDLTADPELRYPQLLLAASFESLLSHSHSSQPRTAVDKPAPEMSLSESWSSLSDYDLSHDEDLQSDATDTGSLIDVSTAEDIHSVDDQAETSDTDELNQVEHEEKDEIEHDLELSHWKIRQQQESHSSPYTSMIDQACIRLDQSVISVDSEGTTVLRASKSLDDADFHSSIGQCTIKMTLSTQNLVLGRKPFHILYHGSKLNMCSSEIKSDVLGKIGAALISSSDQELDVRNAEPSCYHVVPCEFGPGSKSSTADLIPVPTQLRVSDCTVLDNQTHVSNSLSIRLQLSTGTTVTSRPSKLSDVGRTQNWIPPDLCVIVVYEEMSSQERFEAEQVLAFSQRHHIPSICLREGPDWSDDTLLVRASPDMRLNCFEFKNDGGRVDESERNMLLDVESFLALDSEQINQHLRYLIDSATKMKSGPKSIREGLLERVDNTFDDVLVSLFGGVSIPGLKPRSKRREPSCWFLQASPSQSPCANQQYSSTKNPVAEHTSKRHRLMFSHVQQHMKALLFTIVATFAICACRVAFSSLLGAKTLTIQGTSVERYSNCTFTHPVVPEQTVSQALVTTPQTYALPGPLQVLEQQVQSWVPGNYGKRSEAAKDANAASAAETCRPIAISQVPPQLKVDKKILQNRKALFNTQVRRDSNKLPVMLSLKSGRRGVTFFVDEKDFHGSIKIYLDMAGDDACRSIDIESLTPETAASWKDHLHKTLPGNTKQQLPLLELRAAEPTFVQNALDLHYSATRGIGAALEVVERLATKQVGKRQNREAIESPEWDLSKSVHVARDKSLSLVDRARGHVSGSAQNARRRANEVTEKALGEITNAVQVVQDSIGELSLFKRSWHDKMAGTLAQAQHRAQKLVGTSKMESNQAK